MIGYLRAAFVLGIFRKKEEVQVCVVFVLFI
jgi:hypothetical protein